MTAEHRRVSSTVVALALAVAAILSGCAATGNASEVVEPDAQRAYPVVQTFPDIEVLEDLDFGAGEGIRVDVCLPNGNENTVVTGGAEPPTTAPRAAVLSVHGGSWSQGDKANINWRSVCGWLASEGFVGISVNYRLAPANPFPAGIEDVRQVVRWLREDSQAERFDIDPNRIGAFGGSAGGNLVALLGLEGEGPLNDGSRVAAVVDLSGPVDLTVAGFALGGVNQEFRAIQLAYLGCQSYAECPQASAASPIYGVDETDPPFFVGHSLNERIPIEQSDALVEKLRENGIDTEYITVEGSLHSIAMLEDDLRSRIITFLREKLLLTEVTGRAAQ